MNNKKTAPVTQKSQTKTQQKQPKVTKVWRAEDYVSPTVPLEEVLSIKETFDIFDTDKSGLVNVVELKNAFVSLGFAAQNKFVMRMLNDYDTQNNPGIQFAEFLKLSTSRLGETGTRAEVERIFNSFDINKQGKISHADMKKVAEQLNQTLTDQEIQKMIIKADSDKDGFLTADDFYNVLSNMKNQLQTL